MLLILVLLLMSLPTQQQRRSMQMRNTHHLHASTRPFLSSLLKPSRLLWRPLLLPDINVSGWAR
jgi:hypothetical protein